MSSLVNAAPVVAHNINVKAHLYSKKVKMLSHLSNVRGRTAVRGFAGAMLLKAAYNLIPDDAYDWEADSFDEFFGNNL